MGVNLIDHSPAFVSESSRRQGRFSLPLPNGLGISCDRPDLLVQEWRCKTRGEICFGLVYSASSGPGLASSVMPARSVKLESQPMKRIHNISTQMTP